MARVNHGNSITGYALVVNVKYFEDSKDDNREEETVLDQENAVSMVSAFNKLGFDTELVTEQVAPEIYVTIDHFKREFGKALQHVNEHSYKHFAVFISTHGGEVREGDHYIHKLSFYDGDESTEEILFKPLDEQLRKVKKLVIIQACRGRCAAAAGDEDNDDNDGDGDDDDENDGDDDDDNDGDDDDDNDDEDRGVLINVVENPTEEYHAREGDSPSLIEDETVHCVPLCIPNCITMFASPSGRAAYQGVLSSIFLDTVKKSRESVKVLELLREVNAKFAEMDIDWGYYNKKRCYISYDVKNIGSIVHCLTEHIEYPVTD